MNAPKVVTPFATEEESRRSPTPPTSSSPVLPESQTILLAPPEATARSVSPAPRNPIVAALRRTSTTVDKLAYVTPGPYPAVPQLCQRQHISAVTLDSHPQYPYYLAGAVDGKIYLCQYLVPELQCSFALSTGSTVPIKRVRFSPTGMRFGAIDKSGNFALWTFCLGKGTIPPFYKVAAHSKHGHDFAFLNAGTFIATCGSTPPPKRNVCLWDTLMPPQSALVAQCTELDATATSIAYSPRHQLLVVGDQTGAMHTLDIRKFSIMSTVKEHTSAINDLVFDPRQEFLFSGSSDGFTKGWSIPLKLEHSWADVRERSGIQRFRDASPSSVTGLQVLEKDGRLAVFASSQDGKLTEHVCQYAV